jgi:hypothetical protein
MSVRCAGSTARDGDPPRRGGGGFRGYAPSKIPVSHRFRTNTPSSDQFMSRWTEARRVPLTVVVQSGVACLASSRSASSLLRPLQH